MFFITRHGKISELYLFLMFSVNEIFSKSFIEILLNFKAKVY